MANLTFKKLSKALTDVNASWQTNEDIFLHLREVKSPNFSLGVSLPVNYQAPQMVAAAAPVARFAPVVDWRNRLGRNHITPPKQQGGCGSCVSFCTVSVLEAMVSIEKGQLIDLSEADQHFCSSHGANCGGWWHTTGFDQIKARGVCDEASFPYSSAFSGGDIWNGTPSCVINPLRNLKAVKATNIKVINNNVDAKNYLTDVGPLAAILEVYEDFDGHGTGIYRHIIGNFRGLHCITIIGYNEAEQCWICKNSWGTTWGDGGYFRISYGECKIDEFEKVGISGIILPQPILANKVTLFDTSLNTPCICRHNDRIYIAWTGVGNNRINLMSSVNGINFTNKVVLNDTCIGSPSITSHNGKIYLAWTGTDPQHRLNVMSSVDGISFGNKATFGDTSIDGPSLSSFQGKLFISWAGTDPSHRLNVAEII
jgi:hypothetical protein